MRNLGGNRGEDGREREREQKSRLGAFVRPSSQGCLNAYKRNGPRPPTHIIKSALDASCWGKRHDPATPMAAVRRQVSACILYTSAGNGQAGARHTEARRGEASSAWCDLVGRHVASACIWMGGMDEWMNGWMYQITHTYLGTDIIYTVSSAVSLWALQAVIRHTHTRTLSLSLDRQSGSPTGAVSSHPHMARYGSGASHPGRQTSRRISDVLHSFEKAIRPGAEAGGEAAIGHTGPGWRPLVGAEAMLASQGWRQAAGEAYVVYVCMCVVWTRASQAACSAQRPNGRPAFACACLLVRDSRLPYRTHSRALSRSLSRVRVHNQLHVRCVCCATPRPR